MELVKLCWFTSTYHLHSCCVLCFREQSARAKLHTEANVQSREHRAAPHHFAAGRDQRPGLRGLRLQSPQLSGVHSQTQLLQRPHHPVSH